MMQRVVHRAGWVAAGVLGLFVVAAVAAIVRAGPLDPPASTQQTQINSLPYTISASGSYILTHDLTGAGGANGITINAPDVTIDMRGFALVGPGGTGSEYGIYISSGSTQHIAIRNGVIREWAGAALFDQSYQGEYDHLLFDHDGYSASATAGIDTSNATLSDCSVSNSGGVFHPAVLLYGGSVSRCTIQYSTGVGLAATGATISDTTVSNGSMDGVQCGPCSIINATVYANAGIGIKASDTTIGNSSIYANTGDNVMLQENSTLHDSAIAQSSGANGVEVVGTGVVVSRNQIGHNHLDGVFMNCCAGSGDTVEDNTVSYNQGYGVHVWQSEGAATIARNHLAGNTGIAIFLDVGGAALPLDQATEVEGNDIDANGAMHGIEVDTGKNLIIQNRESGSIAAGIIAAGCGGCSANTIGPVETGVTGLSNPWANIVFPN